MSSTGITITAQNRGPVINLLSWILMVVMCLATFVKVYSKWSIMRTLQADDYYLTAAMVCVGLSSLERSDLCTALDIDCRRWLGYLHIPSDSCRIRQAEVNFDLRSDLTLSGG